MSTPSPSLYHYLESKGSDHELHRRIRSGGVAELDCTAHRYSNGRICRGPSLDICVQVQILEESRYEKSVTRSLLSALIEEAPSGQEPISHR